MKLNKYLICKQNLGKADVASIKKLHRKRMKVEQRALETDSKPVLKQLFSRWQAIQHKLQKAWGFPVDISYHMFWTFPKCKCPKWDNYDNYPTGPYYVSSACEIHSK